MRNRGYLDGVRFDEISISNTKVTMELHVLTSLGIYYQWSLSQETFPYGWHCDQSDYFFAAVCKFIELAGFNGDTPIEALEDVFECPDLEHSKIAGVAS